MIVYSGQSNPIALMLVDKSGDPIIAGTINFYLRGLSGGNLGKWWDGAAWSAVEVAIGVGAHNGGGNWSIVIASAAWISGTTYAAYASTVGSEPDSIPVGTRVFAWPKPSGCTVDVETNISTIDVEVSVD